MRKHLTLSGLLLLVSLAGISQQLPHFTYFTYNYLQYNPAVTGATPCLELKFGYRKQWRGLTDGPTTGFANVHGKFRRKKTSFMGLGGMVESDKAGPFVYTSATLMYAYHQKLAKNYHLSMGLGVGFSQYRIDYTSMTLEFQEDDPAVFGNVNSFVFPGINAGLWLYREDRFYGFSIRNVANRKVKGTLDTRLQPHYTFAYGYATRISDEFLFKPAFLLNYVGRSKPSLDAQFVMDYKQRVNFGLAARTGHGISALVKLAAFKYVTIAYAYDLTANKMRYDGANSHEIVIGIRACAERDRYDVPCAAYD